MDVPGVWGDHQVTKTGPIRILVVDDSIVCRELLASLINQTPDLQVVGEAGRGKEAIELNRRLRPQLITMDINMPGMNGFATIEEIMSTAPVPILVVTSAPVVHGVDQTYKAISAGALDLVKKPEFNDADTAVLLEKIRLLAGIRVIRHRRKPLVRSTLEKPKLKGSSIRVVGIASSTGGPKALLEVLGGLSHGVRASFLLTQHLPDGFSPGFVSWLDSELSLDVFEARDGQTLQSGQLLVAPTGYHLTVTPGDIIHLSDEPPVHSHKPSADPMFDSLAEVYGRFAMGVIMTGMGRDGADGLHKLRKTGGLCLGQDEHSCLVFGMPKAAIEIGAVERILDLHGLASTIRAAVSGDL